jgi:hypothetical protein
MIDFRQDLAHAIDAERIDDPAGTMIIEQSRVAPGVIAALVSRGHALMGVGEYDIRPRVQAAGVRPNGVRQAVTDPRADSASLAQPASR